MMINLSVFGLMSIVFLLFFLKKTDIVDQTPKNLCMCLRSIPIKPHHTVTATRSLPINMTRENKLSLFRPTSIFTWFAFLSPDPGQAFAGQEVLASMALA